MSKPISIAAVGIGGYGNHFISALLDAHSPDVQLAGAIDPSPAGCRRLDDLKARNVPIFSTLQAFYEKHRADLAVISSPIQYHAEQACLALSRGSHVLCEKPLCATLEQARQMIRARDGAKIVAIGYQWSFTDAIQKLKADVKAGALGKPRLLKTLVLWPRDEVYYKRNHWAGRTTDAYGNLVFDSPVNNACAHYLHNMLYILGPRVDRSVTPLTVTAELYRAHEIENYDTAALRCKCDDGAELLFIASHASGKRGPVISYEFEKATVDFIDQPGAAFVARFKDGSTRQYGAPNEPQEGKLWLTIDAIRRNAPTICGIEAALPHTQCVVTAQNSEIVDFPRAIVQVSGQPGRRRTVVAGLQEALQQCYDEGKMPSELGFPWARAAREVAVEGA